MAHHIADLIVSTENAAGKERNLAEKNCFEAILTLWKHRAELPNGKRPFEDIEPVVRAIESLDPDSDTPRYFRSARPPIGELKEQSEANTWLAMVDELDYSARVLIRHCLHEAAGAAVDRSKEWVKLAETAAVEDNALDIVIRFVSSNADLEESRGSYAEARGRMHTRIERLEGFIKLAESVARIWKTELETLPPLEEGDDIAAENPR